MSHPDSHHDPENVYPSDDYVSTKKKHMAKKMFKTHGKVMGTMLGLLKKKSSLFFKGGMGGHGELPPGYKDRDNE